MDDHPPGGIDSKDLEPCQQINFEQPYHIPLRSIYSVNRPNLLMAGRNISASHVAFSSTRVMATCATMGQAAGTAAAYCVKNKCLPAEIVADNDRLKWYQQLLLKDDQALIGIRNQDSHDLAPKAKVTASAETLEGKAIKVIDSWNRDVGDGKTHQWQAPIDGAEPWIQLQWDGPQKLSEIQLTFDSGLHRRLFLTGLDSEYFKQIRGPQPETVKDYTIEAQSGSTFVPIVFGKDNFLRFVRHKIDPISTKAIRVRVHQTNADELARIFEIRCYA